jgi:hypothetical protein
MIEELLTLTCECGTVFTRPEQYQTENEKRTNVFFRWKLKYCDTCYRKRSREALKSLPDVLNALINDKNSDV